MQSKVFYSEPKVVKRVVCFLCAYLTAERQTVSIQKQSEAIETYCAENKFELVAAFYVRTPLPEPLNPERMSTEHAIIAFAKNNVDALIFCGQHLESLGVSPLFLLDRYLNLGPTDIEQVYDRLLNPLLESGKFIFCIDRKGRLVNGLAPDSAADQT